MSEQLLQTACCDWHAAHNGRMVDFAGWNMPVQYTTITEEHQAVRTAAGLFDIAHMGRLKFTGPDACRFLDRIVTNDVAKLNVGDIRYALVTNEQGGILDDVLVYRFEDCYFLVVNASNRLKIVDWIGQHQSGFNFAMEDLTQSHFMLAIQGPRALAIATPLLGNDPAELKYYTGTETTVQGEWGIVSRTGYTGEDGCEIIVPTSRGLALWEALIEAGREHGLLPTGLGCRDTLRLEAAMPLYGHELNESIDPYTAGLAFGVKLNAAEFIGRDAVAAAKARTDRPKRVGLELEGRRIAREHTLVYSGDRQTGEVTSGTFSPTLQKPIAMAYVAPQDAEPGTVLEVDLRGKRLPAKVVKLPFYSRG
ncbi:MAG: glycine cleavage system aminomethyltransferase GcvT [Planctomycetaceae bacterium]|nr:glycine cleavage system aminomethyltransferase GcvT [Planctomycetaceae bacterium]